MDKQLRELFSARANIRKKIRFIIKELMENMDKKDKYKFKHLLRNPDDRLYKYIEANFEYRYVEMLQKYYERLSEIDKKINPNIKDVETMLYVECLAFDEELRLYFKKCNTPYQSNWDDKYLHLKIGNNFCNAELIYDEVNYTDYVNLYKIIFEYSWLKEYKGLSNHLLDRLEEMKENEYNA